MITATKNTLDAINESVSVSISNGLWAEYNMNDLIEGVKLRGPNGTDANPAGSLEIVKTAPENQGGYTYKPFEKLFPITSIIDPRRPKFAGIQYMILGDPSIATTLSSGIASNYGTSTEFNKRLYFSSTKTAYKYWVTPAVVGTSLSNCILTTTYPAAKTAAANKITIKFETSHSKPTSWTVKLVNLSGVESAPIYTGTTCPDNGVVNLYFNGTSWSALDDSAAKAWTPSVGVDISGLKLQISSLSVSGGYVGIIEMSARYVVDLTQSLVAFSVTQSSSDSLDATIPVGNVTSNSISVNINSFDKNYESYDKSNAFNKNKLNLYKNAILRPFATVESEKIDLGVFYIDSYSISEWGDISITALDGAKELQYIKPPDIVTKDMSSVSIIRRLLDSVGFTNYKFNLPQIDTATITPYYWYSDNTKTVWEHIQDLCRDTQMIAVFDNKDVLQFYPRDYIFVDSTKKFSFRYDQRGNNLPNIASIQVEDVPSVKAVRVVYSPQLSSAYLASADNIYTSPVVTLGAAALMETLNPVATAETDAPLGIIKLQPVFVEGIAKQLYSYSGYLVIQNEIIEYDAIQYQYIEIGTGTANPTTGQITLNSGQSPKYQWMTSDSDVQKYQGLAYPNTFSPTGKYRIKKRNAFDVLPSTDTASLTHEVNTAKLEEQWKGVKWDVGPEVPSFTPDQSVFTLKSVEVTKENNPKNLANTIPMSMMTIYAPQATKTTNPDKTLPDIYTQNEKYSMATIDASYNTGDSFVLGTNMYFPLTIDPITKLATGNQKTISGIAFSLSSDNKSGYLLSIGTSQNATVDKNYRDINFYKIVNGVPESMITTQKEADGTIITNINGGQLYRIDIRANKATANSKNYLNFKILINNKTFAVIDENPIPVITNKIGLLSLQGISAFDYVYSSPIETSEFLSNNSFDLYKGFLGGESTIIKTFADFIFQRSGKTESKTWIKEFGPVARELKRVQSRYTGPGFPRYPQLVQNPDVTIVGSSLDSFSADMFVINNSGAFTDLANGQEKQFIIVGDYIVPSDPFEYNDPNLTDIEKQEQIGFESTWIQKESEAMALSKWISKQWSTQQKVVTIDTFLNPLLQIGDIVEVSYPANGIYSSEDSSIPIGKSASKFVVLSIESAYDSESSPTTNVVCRSI